VVKIFLTTEDIEAPRGKAVVRDLMIAKKHIHLIGICGTAMASLAGMLAERGFRVTGSDAAAYPPMSDFLQSLGIPVAQPFAGVRQKTFKELEDSLLAMEEVYSQAKETGDRARAQQCRNAVIQAKDHARFAARSPKASPEKKVQKEEMIQWMLVWLDDPGVFPAWVKLRKKKM